MAAAIANGSLAIHGWIYDIAHADLWAFDPARGKFVAVAPGNDSAPEATPLARFALTGTDA